MTDSGNRRQNFIGERMTSSVEPIYTNETLLEILLCGWRWRRQLCCWSTQISESNVTYFEVRFSELRFGTCFCESLQIGCYSVAKRFFFFKDIIRVCQVTYEKALFSKLINSRAVNLTVKTVFCRAKNYNV